MEYSEWKESKSEKKNVYTNDGLQGTKPEQFTHSAHTSA